MAKKRRSKKQPGSLTDVEWTILNVVWEHEPCAAGTVRDDLAETHNWAYSTVKTTMDRMVVKGLLGTQSIRNLTLFTSLISRDDAKRGELKRFLSRAFNGALTPMIQFLVDEKELSDEELKELRKTINRARRRTE